MGALERIDETDARILELLQRDGRESYAEVGLAHRPNPVSVVMVVPSSVVLGSEGIPIFIDDQRVYGLNENALWQDLNDSFLLAAYVPWVLRRRYGLLLRGAEVGVSLELDQWA